MSKGNWNMKRLVAVAAPALVLAGCGHSGTTAPASPVVQASSPAASAFNLHALGQAYLGIVAQGNAAIRAAKNLPTNTPAEIQAFFSAAAKAFTATDAEVAALRLPPSMVQDQHAVIAALAALAEDARLGESASTLAALQQVEAQIAADETKEASVSAVLRADLGLPPPS